jgi:hypothetical protein
MTSNKLMVGAALVAAVAAGAVASSARVQAFVPSERQNTLTFSRVVALPGVTMPPGRYVFEIVELGGGNLDVVRVSSADRRIIYYSGFTRGVKRPRTDRDRFVTFGEPVQGAATPIRRWYPIGQADGHEFIYGPATN